MKTNRRWLFKEGNNSQCKGQSTRNVVTEHEALQEHRLTWPEHITWFTKVSIGYHIAIVLAATAFDLLPEAVVSGAVVEFHCVSSITYWVEFLFPCGWILREHISLLLIVYSIVSESTAE